MWSDIWDSDWGQELLIYDVFLPGVSSILFGAAILVFSFSMIEKTATERKRAQEAAESASAWQTVSKEAPAFSEQQALEQLAALREQGALTEQEYQEKRAQIIAKL